MLGCFVKGMYKHQLIFLGYFPLKESPSSTQQSPRVAGNDGSAKGFDPVWSKPGSAGRRSPELDEIAPVTDKAWKQEGVSALAAYMSTYRCSSRMTAAHTSMLPLLVAWAHKLLLHT